MTTKDELQRMTLCDDCLAEVARTVDRDRTGRGVKYCQSHQTLAAFEIRDRQLQRFVISGPFPDLEAAQFYLEAAREPRDAAAVH